MARFLSFIVTAAYTEEEYTRRQRQALRKIGQPGAEFHRIATPALAHISDGRWVADCVCGSASVVSPAYKDSRCGECGTTQPLVFPGHRAQIEALLVMRPMGARVWRNEALSDLAITSPGLGLRRSARS